MVLQVPIFLIESFPYSIQSNYEICITTEVL